MSGLRTTPAVALALLFAAPATAPAADPRIGHAQSAKNKVEGVIGTQNQNISSGSSVFTNETVRTGPTGVAKLVFLDDTKLSVGPISEVRLDKFVYDPGGSSGRVVFQAAKGAFRFVTGSQNKRAYEVKTPFGSLGVRGTIVEIVVKPCVRGQPPNTCGVSLRLVEGNATFTTTSGQTIELTPGTVLHVNGAGQFTKVTQAHTILRFALAGPPHRTHLAAAPPEFPTLVPPAASAPGPGLGVVVGGLTGLVIYELIQSPTPPASP